MNQDLHTLVDSSASLSLEYYSEDYPVLRICNASAHASVALHGAHVIDWQPVGEEPVIYNSPEAIYREGKAIRGGVPVCWPWFNAHPTNSTLPSHGFVRNRYWSFDAVTESDELTTLYFRLNDSEETQALWPHSFEVLLIIEISNTLTISLKTTNHGSTPLTVGGALHTYLKVSDVSKIHIEGLSQTSYIDTVGTEAEREQEGLIEIREEVDRIYQNTRSDITLVDKDWGRHIVISRRGSQSAVVWNPWIEKGASLADLPNEGYRDFVCIEATNAREDVYTLQTGDTHTLSTGIQVNRLS